jgi:hypothetical protein
VISTIVLAYIFKLQKYNLESKRTFIYADTIGLISFSVSGAIIAVEQGLSIVGVMFLALLTATGGRPNQLKRLNRWMNKQTYKGKVLWIVVDDCEPRTANDIVTQPNSNWEVVIINSEEIWKLGMNTQIANLELAIKEMKQHKEVTHFFIIEDDDYYAPNYLSVMMEHLLVFKVVTGVYTLIVRPKDHLWRVEMATVDRGGSLFESAFNISMLPLFEEVMSKKPLFLDVEFWKVVPKKKLFQVFEQKRISIGIKGYEGRPGVVTAHRSTNNFNEDLLNIINFQLGKDAKYYYENE